MSTKRISKIAVSTALLNGGKLALAFVPNVEIVTTVLIVFALVYARRDAIFISFLFVVIEIMIYGFEWSWVLLYLVYWPLLVLAVSLLPKHKLYSIIISVAIGIAFTACFGLLSSFIEMAVTPAWGKDYFWPLVYYRYIAGIPFFVIHIVSNSIALPVLVYPLYRVLYRVDRKFDEKKVSDLDNVVDTIY